MAKKQYKNLSIFEAARLRTEMYAGSREPHTQTVPYYDGNSLKLQEFTWVPALLTLFRELLDNSLDEIVGHGHGNTLTVDYNPDTMEIMVMDNGNGLPIQEIPHLGKGAAASILMSETHAGSNFDDNNRDNVGGTNGLGAAIANFTSEYFQLDVWNSKSKGSDSQHLRQKWTEGTYRGKEIHKTKPATITKGAKGKTGTRIIFKPSSKVFPKMILPVEFIASRLWDIAVTNPKVRIIFNGNRLVPKIGKDRVISTYFKGASVAPFKIEAEGITGMIYASNSFGESEEIVHMMVNRIPTFKGGTHVDGFKNFFYPAVMNELSQQRVKEKLRFRRDDVSTGLFIFGHLSINAPFFDSQEKSRLVSEIANAIKKAGNVDDVAKMIKQNPKWVEEIRDRCRSRTNSRANDEANKKQRALSKTKIAKLFDATGKSRKKCVLFLAEGDSAISQLTSVRNPEIHGGLPLRGKLLNVNGANRKTVVDNVVLSNIMVSLGLQIGTKANPNFLRYGKVYIATDEDEDGKAISALLVNFLYTYWPELFQDKRKPYVYKFSTPFIIASKGNKTKYVYAHDYDAFSADTKKYKGWDIRRAKGLGTLSKKDWQHAIDEPVLIPIIDDGELESTLDLIFNKDRADDRKEWLATGQT